jgi:hypothetical protein
MSEQVIIGPITQIEWQALIELKRTIKFFKKDLSKYDRALAKKEESFYKLLGDCTHRGSNQAA